MKQRKFRIVEEKTGRITTYRVEEFMPCCYLLGRKKWRCPLELQKYMGAKIWIDANYFNSFETANDWVERELKGTTRKVIKEY